MKNREKIRRPKKCPLPRPRKSPQFLRAEYQKVFDFLARVRKKKSRRAEKNCKTQLRFRAQKNAAARCARFSPLETEVKVRETGRYTLCRSQKNNLEAPRKKRFARVGRRAFSWACRFFRFQSSARVLHRRAVLRKISKIKN